jgi:serine/threonine protein kinase
MTGLPCSRGPSRARSTPSTASSPTRRVLIRNQPPIHLPETRRRVVFAGADMAFQPGQLFGNYRIVRLIGEGGFGEVYLVENPLIARRAAVKVLHTALAQDPELVRRFLNEARAASAIHHPNIVEVFDAGGMSDGAPYILMEFLEGISLQKRLADRSSLALPQAMDIANQAGSALIAAHAAGIVHRDLKPENLFLVSDPSAPGGERVKVLDFGIAKISAGRLGGTVRTQTGLIMGSPAYMSPEQCKDSADVDLRSDIYSFATIIYEMLAGRTPHVAATGTELLVMHLTETPRPLRELVADLPAHVEATIMRALARAREDRFGSMTDFLSALQVNKADDSAVPRQSASSNCLVMAGASHEGTVGKDALLRGATTFSRATGEMGEDESNEDPMVASTRSRRWRRFAVGGTVVVGLGLLLLALARPGQDSQRRAASVSGPVRAVIPVRKEIPQPELPTVLPSGADASTIPSNPAGASSATKQGDSTAVPVVPAKRPHQEATNESLPKPAKDTKRRQTANLQKSQKPEDVAGF